MKTYPKLEGFPNQPDDRIRAMIFNGDLPDTYSGRLQLAFDLAQSCITIYGTPQGDPYSYLDYDDNGKYARETGEEITYLMTLPLPNKQTEIDIAEGKQEA